MRRTALLRLPLLVLTGLALASCALFAPRDPLNVQVAGLEPLPGEGLEWRLMLVLRVQNPNDAPVAYDGLALSLEVNDRELASGVSDRQGEVPRFGETLIRVPMTVSALSVARQLLGLASPTPPTDLPYRLRGKLAGGAFGVHRFEQRGTLDLDDLGLPTGNPYGRDNPYRTDR